MDNQAVRKRLGDMLIDAGKINDVQLKKALERQKETQQRLGQVLIELGYISETDMLDEISKQTRIERISLDQVYVDPDSARLIPREVAKKYLVIPFRQQDGKLHIAINDPLNVFAIDDVRFITKRDVKVYIEHKSAIERAIELYLNRQTSERAVEDLKREYRPDDKSDDLSNEDIANAPAVRLVNSIINQAVTARASDIHVEPFEKDVVVRYRVDGVLSEAMQIPQRVYSAVLTRFKIMAEMNIAEKRIPQDGRIELQQGEKLYDLRVSTLPTVFGEKIVIRILDRTQFLFDRKSLGFTEKENNILDMLIHAPYGIMLVTGPTGSGKSTTLYSFLKEINTPDRNIVTVEDPVEYMIRGINQVQVNTKAGLTFAAGLRSILRQDPDVIMIGEIRDEETAQMAIRASITGHFVLSTLHTNDSVGAITRLLDMGLPGYLVGDAVSAVIAQRLVRRVCRGCAEQYPATASDAVILGINEGTRLVRGKGCPTCGGSGYKGRIAVHEILLITKEIRELIEKNAPAESIRELASVQGFDTLKDNCRRLVLDGMTSVQEMVKTVYVRD